MVFNKLGLGLALACGSLAIGANFAAPAQAATLQGTVNIAGVADFVSSSFTPPATDTIRFTNATVQTSSTGIFASYIGQGVTFSNLLLSSPTNVSVTPQQSRATYSASTVNPLIEFGNNLRFIVDSPFAVERVATRISGVTSISGSLVFTGLFQNATGQNLGVGSLTLQESRNQGSFSLTVDTATVPEPSTMFGLTTVLAAGYLSRKKLVKKQVIQRTHS